MACFSYSGSRRRHFFIPGNQKQDVPMYVGIGIIILSIGLYLMISKTHIIVGDSGITHKTIFKTREIAWNSIFRTYLKSEHHGKSRSLYWYFENALGKKTKIFDRSSFKKKSSHSCRSHHNEMQNRRY
jgi:hypothetical protein